MTDITEPIAQSEASDEEVAEALSALMETVTETPEPAAEAVAESEPAPAKAPAKKKAPAKRKTAKPTDLNNTVDTLVGSVASLVKSVETLTERIPVPENSVAAETRVDESAADKPEVATTLKGIGTDIVFTLGKYMGVGLVGAGAFKAGDNIAWLGAAALGCIVFTLCAALRSDDTANESLIKRAGGAALTAIGLGLVVGGVQFFGSDGSLAAKLIPVGLPLFAVGLLLGSRHKLSTEHMVWVGGVAVWVCLALFVGLNALAGGGDDKGAEQPAPAAASGEHGEAAKHGAKADDGHGEAAAAGHDETPSTTAAPGAAADSHGTAGASHDEPASAYSDAEHEAIPATTLPVVSSAKDLAANVAKANEAAESTEAAAPASSSHH